MTVFFQLFSDWFKHYDPQLAKDFSFAITQQPKKRQENRVRDFMISCITFKN